MHLLIKKILESGVTTLISKEEINYIMKIVKSLEGSGLLIKGVSPNQKPKKVDFSVYY